MKSEIVNLLSGALSGEWRHGKLRKRLIIVCHGYQGSNEDPTIIAITDGLNNKGHDTFTFNFSKNIGGFDIEHQVHDIKKIADNFGEYEELILLAGSFAALTAAIATIKLSSVSRLITLNGFFGKGDLGQEHRKTYIKFRIAALFVPTYRRILKYYRHELQPGLIKVPVLVVHSKADKYVFIKQSQDFYEQLIAPKHFVELAEAKHGITANADRQEVISEIHKWLSYDIDISQG